MSESPLPTGPPVVVGRLQPGDPPFRVVQVNGEIVGVAHSLVDVIALAIRAGVPHVDYEDPAEVRWVGGGMYTWG